MIKIIAAIFLFSIQTFASTELGNGGDSVLQSFNLRGMQVGYYLQERPELAQKFGLNVSKFLEVVKNTKLAAKDRLYLNGIEVDAINYPNEGRIEVSRQRWLLRGGDQAFLEERRLVLHEYLWMQGMDDTDYRVSNAIMSDFERDAGPLQDPEVRQLLLDKMCLKIIKNDFESATKYLSWGLDLNSDCAGDSIAPAPPISFLLSYARRTTDLPEKQLEERRRLLRKLLVYGTNPNGYSNLWAFERAGRKSVGKSFFLGESIWNIEDVNTLIEFGADPNIQDTRSGRTIFADAMDWQGVSVEAFLALLHAGGDVNLNLKYRYGDAVTQSVARVIIERAGNPQLVEALITQAKVNWCRIDLNGAWTPTTLKVIDHVLPEYKPLLEKYGVSCP
jgi:hypothetical protein